MALLSLAGWHLHLTSLVQLHPGVAPLQYNAAVCFLLLGSALLLRTWQRGCKVFPLLGAVAAAGGLGTLAEYLLHVSLGIDQFLFHSYITTQTSHPGRMSPIAAFSFALAGLCLVLLGVKGAVRWRALVIGSSASVIGSFSIVALLGYGFGLPGAYGWGELTRLAPQSGVGFCLVAAGLFAIAWNLEDLPRERTPRWLPVPVALGIITASLVLCFALDARQNDQTVQTVKAAAEGVDNQIAVRIEARAKSLVRMASRWEFSGAPSRAAWEADAGNYVHDFPDLQAIQWIDASHILRWIVPLAGNQAKLNLDLTREDRRSAALTEAGREHQPVFTRIVTLFRGGLGFVVYVPIVVHGQSDGFIAAVFNAQACMARYLPPTVAEGEAIQISESGQVFYQRDAIDPPLREDWVVPEKIVLHGATWDMKMWPTAGLTARLDSPMPTVILVAGVLGALLLGAVCFLAQRFSRQAVATLLANAALQAALDKVKTLEGMLPICSYCKRVRNDDGYWSQIDTYIHEHTNASLSHGYCPECAAKAFKDFGFEVPEEVQIELEAHNFE